ncbi:MAG TPA: hypothetical protein VEY30_14675, partial [Myxococcaceae bacterium]|nr:hypothetical protein [Myxococcaceae bacterium]
MYKHLLRWGWPAAGILLVGCSDVVSSRVPVPAVRTSQAPPHAPGDFQIDPWIFSTHIDVGIDAGAKKGYTMASMDFWGSHGKIDATLSLRFGTSVVESRTLSAEDFRSYPWRRELQNTANWLSVTKTCGFTASGSASYSAWHEYFGDSWGRKTVPRASTFKQPDCTPCTGGPPIRKTTYDPYESGEEDCGGGGGDEEGSGTQFGEGDLTGGETVSWSSGTGNGGSSACGSEARAAYICMDTWDGTNWVQWGCGWVTT